MEVVRDICDALVLRCAFSDVMLVLMMAGMMHSFALQTFPARRRRDFDAVGELKLTAPSFVPGHVAVTQDAARRQPPCVSQRRCSPIGRPTGPRAPLRDLSTSLVDPVEAVIDPLFRELEGSFSGLVKRLFEQAGKYRLSSALT
jgi:hypothetical protein